MTPKVLSAETFLHSWAKADSPVAHAAKLVLMQMDDYRAVIGTLEKEVAKWKVAFEVEKAINEEALEADRAVQKALGRAEGQDGIDELVHRLAWAAGFLRSMPHDREYAMRVVIEGIEETLGATTGPLPARVE